MDYGLNFVCIGVGLSCISGLLAGILVILACILTEIKEIREEYGNKRNPGLDKEGN